MSTRGKRNVVNVIEPEGADYMDITWTRGNDISYGRGGDGRDYGTEMVAAAVGPDVSTDLTDTNATFAPETTFPALLTAAFAGTGSCKPDESCYAACKSADRINREKCNVLRKNVACALRDAGCPSNIKPMKRAKKKKCSTTPPLLKAIIKNNRARSAYPKGFTASGKPRSIGFTASDIKKFPKLIGGKYKASLKKGPAKKGTKAKVCRPTTRKSRVSVPAAPKIICEGGVCRRV